MNIPDSTPTDLHQQIQLLLPWYLNQSLARDEHEQVESHVRHCLLCRRELNSLQKLANHLTEASDLEAAAEASFNGFRTQLMAKAANTAPTITRAKTANNSTWAIVSGPYMIRFAAALLLVVMVPLIWHGLQPNTLDGYYTLSAAKPEQTGGQQIRVVFAKSLPDSEVDAILLNIHGRKVDAGNSVGAFTVELDNTHNLKINEVIALLRSRQDVLLVEPVLQP